MTHRMTVHPPRRWPLATTAVTMAALLLAVFRWSAVVASPSAHWVDLDVYQRGALALLRGEDLYAVSVHGLYFTYPPFGAAIFTPLSGLPEAVARWGFTGVSLTGFAVAMVVVGRRAGLRLPVSIAVSAAVAWSEPFSQGLVLGQVNTILMAMVLVDLLLVSRGRQGYLVGLAAGIKLIPAVFVLYFVLKRDWRSVGRSLLGLLVSVGVGAAFDPGATWRYWSGGFLALGRFGPGRPFASDNQSLTAFLDRIFHAASLPLTLTVIGCLVGVGMGVLAARRALARGDDLGAVLALALGGLLASPVSWSHHWIWFAPVALVLAADREWVTLWVLGLPFLIGPFWLMPVRDLRELHYSWWQVLVSGCYPIAGMVVLTLWSRRKPRRSDRAPIPGRGSQIPGKRMASSQGVKDAIALSL
ncbi:glycosyltransferase 87 family protein [Lapillicoccus sp.]|uniref:glycosyltransferase 87 family protein n=1 Tax=Lapillicoccus sp. TaxID=1909287 RepID=UPI0025D13900|nr:glycosyltransferase 87 family protein [Lapillicoccus sp.]